MSTTSNVKKTKLPRLYEYYAKPEIISGLETNTPSEFTLNQRPITIYSGAIHYFRVPSAYWPDRLRKLKAAGLNTVETYIPWNLHEACPKSYDFGNGNTDFNDFLDVVQFLRIAQEEDLFAIVRPGPYICSEWDFGGLPSWLLNVSDIKLRTSCESFMKYVRRYFKVLLKELVNLQFSNGGPIIAFQIENEYGNVKVEDQAIDSEYLTQLVEILREEQIVELLFTSDTPSNGTWGTIPNILNTANFQTDAIKELRILKRSQPKKPLMVTEFWTGWFDHWGENHHQLGIEQFRKELEDILSFPASVNFYMFHGGTNWGFMNGANIMQDGNVAFDTSSYDYDAPLTENGDYTEKYHVIKELIAKHNQIKVRIPELPQITRTIKFDNINSGFVIDWRQFYRLLRKQNAPVTCKTLKNMEKLHQNYGYIVYSIHLDLRRGAVLEIEEKVRDTLLVLVNGELINEPFRTVKDLDAFGYWRVERSRIVLTKEDLSDARLTLIVENFGRVNYGKLHQFDQKRGLCKNPYVDGKEIENWDITKIEFDKKLNRNIEHAPSWKAIDAEMLTMGPKVFKFEMILDEEQDIADTFIDMSSWTKGIVIVNGFVLSRYFKAGPQQTCYLPEVFLVRGVNVILIFEHFQYGGGLYFSDQALYFKTS